MVERTAHHDSPAPPAEPCCSVQHRSPGGRGAADSLEYRQRLPGGVQRCLWCPCAPDRLQRLRAVAAAPVPLGGLQARMPLLTFLQEGCLGKA